MSAQSGGPHVMIVINDALSLGHFFCFCFFLKLYAGGEKAMNKWTQNQMLG